MQTYHNDLYFSNGYKAHPKVSVPEGVSPLPVNIPARHPDAHDPVISDKNLLHIPPASQKNPPSFPES